MNEQNFDYLSRQLKFTGFGEEIQRALLEKLQLQLPEFTLHHHASIGSDKVEAALQFSKSAQSDMYFFNRYQLMIKNEKGDESLAQTFRVGRENNITLKEAYNLMHGRAVHKEMTPKEGEKYNAWLQLDFKQTEENGNFKFQQYHQNYGYDLRQTLAKYPIRELEKAETAQSLVRSLERGNRHQVTMVQEGKENKMFIEANPKYKSITVYNSDMLRVNVHSEKLSSPEKQSEKKTERQAVARETPVEEIKKKKHSKRQALKGEDGEAGSQKQKLTRKQSQTLS
ncbi:MAG: hypothetical protein C5B59_09965 [Bacteroidetes bacterium]|nr:MAG: hypothetical protein C5B59_09965 [Bacteroidota bacterium]